MHAWCTCGGKSHTKNLKFKSCLSTNQFLTLLLPSGKSSFKKLEKWSLDLLVNNHAFQFLCSRRPIKWSRSNLSARTGNYLYWDCVYGGITSLTNPQREKGLIMCQIKKTGYVDGVPSTTHGTDFLTLFCIFNYPSSKSSITNQMGST